MTTLFGNAAITTTVIPATPAISAAPVEPKKHNLLPVLVALFLISYGLMTMLIIEQGRTIESQRALIHELFHESQELAAVQGRTLQPSVVESQTQMAQMPSITIPSAATPSTQIPSTQAQAPKTQAPSTQARANHAPSTQVAPRSRIQARRGKMAQPELQLPSRPASDLADDRRALKTI
ncbi:MAG TPA: hypothetical protein VIW68_09635 [Candidatus Sulfotelmatobacter sp.]